MKNWAVIGYYTLESPYENEAHGMQTSVLEVARAASAVYAKLPRKTWAENCGIKPEVILQAMHDLADEFSHIIYLDADARFVGWPKLFYDPDFDPVFAARYRKGELLSGTLVFSTKNSRVVDLVSEWIVRQREKPHIWDQKILQAVLESPEFSDIEVTPLPIEYVHIFDELDECDYPIIEHYQKSREYRGLVKRSRSL